MAAAEASRQNAVCTAVPVLSERPLARGLEPAAAWHAGFAVLALTAYASQSLYPTLSPELLARLFLSIALPLALVLIARGRLHRRLVRHARGRPRAALLFAADWALYVAAGAGILAALALWSPHPVAPGLRLAAATVLIGYFAALDLTLRGPAEPPLRWGFAWMGALTAGIAIGCTTLALYDHLARLLARLPDGAGLQPRLFLLDAVVLSLPPWALALRAGDGYARALQQRLERHIALLRQVAENKLTLPATAREDDDFAVLLTRIVAGLREKQRVLDTLERSVGAEVMRTLLVPPVAGTATAATQEHEVVVLHCDLRGFTSFAERAAPEEVLFLLNAYFSRVVATIAEHGGLVNKFLGDAVLAIFGLDDLERAPERALYAAQAIRAHVDAHREAGHRRLDTGISIHAGRAVAGRLGSAERYEYTFVGETVNTAIRLDGLTKRLGVDLLVSEAVYRRLPATMRRALRELGRHRLRGAEEMPPVRVYGLANAAAD